MTPCAARAATTPSSSCWVAVGAGTNRGFWSRVVMAESNGVWLMEMIHGLTGLKDFYDFANDTDPAVRSIDVVRRDGRVEPDPPHGLT